MIRRNPAVWCALVLSLSLSAPRWLPTASSFAADQKLVIAPVTEKKIGELPSGELYWRLETFPSLAQAQAAAGPLSLAAEIADKAWLFTLGPKSGPTRGATKVAEVGPVPRISAPEYLLRINRAGGPPGAKTRCIRTPGRSPSMC